MDFDELIKKMEEMELLMKRAATLATVARNPEKALDYLNRAKTLDQAIHTMREYIEPWSCPDCGHVRKIPLDTKAPGSCPACQNNNMLPYAYKEQKRMDGQLRFLLPCVMWYSKQENGQVATQCLNGLAEAGQKNIQKTDVQVQR